MDRRGHGIGRLAACLAVLAAFMTLGHLVGMLGHGDLVHHGHAAHGEPEGTDCVPDAESPGHGESHSEANCGALIQSATADPASVPDLMPPVPAAGEPAPPSGTGELGPNGRSPPERSLLQISRI